MLESEQAAIESAKNHGGNAGGHDERHELLQPPAKQQAGDGDDTALADVAEHHAEHGDEGQCEQPGGVDLAIARHAVVAHQGCERHEPSVVAYGRGHARELLRQRVARAQYKTMPELRLQAPAQVRQIPGRRPTADEHEPPTTAQRLTQLGVGSRERQHLRRRDQLALELLLGTLDQLALRIGLVHDGLRPLLQLPAHLLRPVVQFGRDGFRAPSGHLQHGADFLLPALESGDHHVVHAVVMQKRGQRISGEADGLLEAGSISRRHHADVHVEKTFGTGEQSEIDVERGEVVERFQQLIDALVFLLDASQSLLAARAQTPHFVQPLVQLRKLALGNRARRRWRTFFQATAMSQDLVEAGTGAVIELAVRNAGKFRQTSRPRLRRLGIEHAFLGQALGCERRVLAQNLERDALHRQGPEHAYPSAAREAASRISSGCILRRLPLITARSRRRSRSRNTR